MPTRPKSISIHELSGAVSSALAKLKVKPSPDEGPWFFINPGIICGLIFNGPIVEANGLAAAIATDVSAHAGITVAPVVQQGAASVGAAATEAFRPNHVICGYKHDLQIRA